MAICLVCHRRKTNPENSLCVFCRRQYIVCGRCGIVSHLAQQGGILGDANEKGFCLDCKLGARGICGNCGKPVFSEDFLTRRGRRSGPAIILCAQCHVEANPLAYTELCSEDEVGLPRWGDDSDLLEREEREQRERRP